MNIFLFFLILGVIFLVYKKIKSKKPKNLKLNKFKNKLQNPVTLENIKKIKALENLSLIKQSRLSVMPIDTKSWKIILKMGRIN